MAATSREGEGRVRETEGEPVELSEGRRPSLEMERLVDLREAGSQSHEKAGSWGESRKKVSRSSGKAEKEGLAVAAARSAEARQRFGAGPRPALRVERAAAADSGESG